MRCSLWQDRNGPKRVERGRTSVAVEVRAGVVLEVKLQGVGCARADRPLGRRAQQRTGAKRATAGWRVIDRGRAQFDRLQIACVAVRGRTPLESPQERRCCLRARRASEKLIRVYRKPRTWFMNRATWPFAELRAWVKQKAATRWSVTADCELVCSTSF